MHLSERWLWEASGEAMLRPASSSALPSWPTKQHHVGHKSRTLGNIFIFLSSIHSFTIALPSSLPLHAVSLHLCPQFLLETKLFACRRPHGSSSTILLQSIARSLHERERLCRRRYADLLVAYGIRFGTVRRSTLGKICGARSIWAIDHSVRRIDTSTQDFLDDERLLYLRVNREMQ